ncbi:unnamed protein product [Ilex paraguariensis]|uniref:Uncharacterized protein n=1 Tax=Ilex paraguariensis TaxID=185542 RepID=A0ABC8T9B5_9AQUA
MNWKRAAKASSKEMEQTESQREPVEQQQRAKKKTAGGQMNQKPQHHQLKTRREEIPRAAAKRGRRRDPTVIQLIDSSNLKQKGRKDAPKESGPKQKQPAETDTSRKQQQGTEKPEPQQENSKAVTKGAKDGFNPSRQGSKGKNQQVAGGQLESIKTSRKISRNQLNNTNGQEREPTQNVNQSLASGHTPPSSSTLH